MIRSMKTTMSAMVARNPALAALSGLVAAPALALVVGAAAWAMGAGQIARWAWAVGTAVVLAALVVSMVRHLRRGEFGLDAIAALAMASALTFGEQLAGAVVALMYAGGQALEEYAQGHAAREMTSLLARAPRHAVVHRDGALATIAIDDVVPGDRLMVRTGEVVPVDGVLIEGVATLDESALTGESLPVTHATNARVMSGVVNVGPPFDLSATHRAADSTYAGIVRLVDAARRSKAPLSRIADRYALGFFVLTVSLAGLAWLVSSDPLRLVAVLVVATPCPLILAVPVAIVAGMSRAAGRGILIKSARALEALGRIRTLLIDKTGTLTHGRSRVMAVETMGEADPDEVLRTAASLAQASRHTASEALVDAALARGQKLTTPTQVVETAGAGVKGSVEGRQVAIGRADFVAAHAEQSAGAPHTGSPGAPGVMRMTVAIDGAMQAKFTLADAVRDDAAHTLQGLRDGGINRIVLLTGDRAGVAAPIASALGIDACIAEASPEGKIDAVVAELGHGPTMMVGDGINDAAALARADVGVALAAHGSAAAIEAADVVVLVDRLDRITDAMAIARDTRGIALQSALAGMALSLIGMVVAALGYLPPINGAIAQEVIDVAVVLNGLRALGGGLRARR
jgi:heavy metal translocating P-type ATPase